MKVEVKGKTQSSIREVFLDSATILRYMMGNDDQLETLIMCNPGHNFFTTTDKELYEALGSIKPYDSFVLGKLVKLLEQVSMTHDKKKILTDEIVEKTRHEALKR